MHSLTPLCKTAGDILGKGLTLKPFVLPSRSKLALLFSWQDIYGQTTASLALDVISKIGCAISILALLVMLVTYLYSK